MAGLGAEFITSFSKYSSSPNSSSVSKYVFRKIKLAVLPVDRDLLILS